MHPKCVFVPNCRLMNQSAIKSWGERFMNNQNVLQGQPTPPPKRGVSIKRFLVSRVVAQHSPIGQNDEPPTDMDTKIRWCPIAAKQVVRNETMILGTEADCRAMCHAIETGNWNEACETCNRLSRQPVLSASFMPRSS